MGLLANTDSSMLNVKLDHGFEIRAMSDEEGIKYISILEDLPYGHLVVPKKLSMDYRCINHSERKLYFVANSFKDAFEVNEKGVVTPFPFKAGKLVSEYLDPVVRLMRLFKEGNICMPLEYYYYLDNDTPIGSMWKWGPKVLLEPYTLKRSEIPDLQRFIHDTKIPFKEPFLQLAFENFELSYQNLHTNSSFVSLMISLEVLFNRADQELAYTISRNTAVLLGKDEKDSKNIFREMKQLYRKRSKIVHTGERNIVNNKDLSKLRHYVRESIKEINNIDKKKDDVFELLNSSGFGERAWKK